MWSRQCWTRPPCANLFNSMVFPVVLYARKIWSTTNKEEQQLVTMERSMQGILLHKHCNSRAKQSERHDCGILNIELETLQGSQTTGRPKRLETINQKTFMMIGKQNRQMIQTNIEKKYKSKNTIEVHCGQQCGKHRMIWAIRG